MANYFYTDAGGNRRGPFRKDQIEQLVMYKHITPTTLLETDDGNKMRAEEIPGFGERSTRQMPSEASSNFLDIGFTRFITNTWISFIWVLVIVAHILGFLVGLGCSLWMTAETGFGFFLLWLLFGTPLTLLSLLFSRIALESAVVLFRIESHLRRIREHYENL